MVGPLHWSWHRIYDGCVGVTGCLSGLLRVRMHVLPCFSEVLLTAAQMIFAGLLFGMFVWYTSLIWPSKLNFYAFPESWSGQIGIDHYFPVHQMLLAFHLIWHCLPCAAVIASVYGLNVPTIKLVYSVITMSLSMAAVAGCLRRCRLYMQYSCQAQRNSIRDDP